MRPRLPRLRRPAKRRGLTEPVLHRPAYADRHAGRTLLVLGNGPTLTTHAAELHALIAQRDAVVLGANHITPFRHPDYHAFTNRKRFFDYASTFDPARSRLLVSPAFEDEFVRAHVPEGAYERLMYVADHDVRFDVRDGVILSGCRTVSVLLLGVAVVMGAAEILVAGLDGYAAGGRPLYHAETRVLKEGDRIAAEVHAYTTRFLAEIQEHLARQARAPFAIVTPTAYAEHYRSDLLRA